ncbi:MAG: extracellular solute-binding protein [Oscillospiraceae bacterium]
MKNTDMKRKGYPRRAGAALLCTVLTLLLCLSGCGKEKSLLDPQNPTVVTLWHYQDGNAKAQLDAQITKFNETVGKAQGIVIDAQSRGNSMQLAEVLFDAANKKIGSDPMPDIFTAYPDNAYRIDELIGLVDLEDYFSEVELEAYYPTFLENDRIGPEGALKLLPVSKSTEAVFLNQTDWDKFAAATGATVDTLATWEGIAKTAESYYNWTDSLTAQPDDGKAFWGVDSMYHFMLMASKQAGEELYGTDGSGGMTFQYSETLARRIWDNYYIPYLSGYYAKNNTYTSADVAAGTIIASVMSTAGGNYFPTEMTENKSEGYPVTCTVLPYPCLTEGVPFAPIRGMDMCIAKSDAPHEYAAALFLKWLTAPEQNSIHTAAIGFLPVQKGALTEEAINTARAQVLEVAPNPAITVALQCAQKMLKTHTLYNGRPFPGDYEVKQLLETSLPDLAQSDLEELTLRVGQGENRQELLAEYSGDTHFRQWYTALVAEANQIIAEKR